MQLGRYQVSTLRPPPILGVHFSHDGRVFAVATDTGYEVWRTWPVGLLRRRALPGTLSRAVPIPQSALLVLQGGGSNPLYPPNKAIIYHDAQGVPVAELEFGERIRGIAVRPRTIVIMLLRRVLAYEYTQDAKSGFSIRSLGEWETAENDNGLCALATAPGSTLLALPGRQPGHVQLIHLPPRPAMSPCDATGKSSMATTFRSPILLAHTHRLSALACSATGTHLVTASERGTLLRVWDTARGALESELRRGVDPAEIWGVLFEDSVFDIPLSDPDRRREHAKRKGGRVVGWSDKGTVHVWGGDPPKAPSKSSGPSITKVLSKAMALPNYFSSQASFAQYYIPRKNPHAFSSAIGAAADAAGIPSMKINEEVERKPEDREMAERYIVTWIEVEVDDIPPEEDKVDKFRPRRPTGGMTMGTREERRSFGSDATSTRTVTPNQSRRAETPPVSARDNLHRRTSSGGGSARGVHLHRPSRAKRTEPSTPTSVTKRIERQLVVMTFSGDWYRLRLPQPRPSGEDSEDKVKTACELVEYRRLQIGGGGW